MKTILVADDSRIMRNMIKNAFTKLQIPCTFLEAENGHEALRLLETNQVSLVFLDTVMPEMNGLEFLEKVRARGEYEDLPIIMVTSEAAKYNKAEALQAGATDYIVKPFRVKTFLEKLSEIPF